MKKETDQILHKGDSTNDFCMKFLKQNLDFANFALLPHATRMAYRELTGKEPRFLKRTFSAIDEHFGNALVKDWRPNYSFFYNKLLMLAESGGDLSHPIIGKGTAWYNDLRCYRDAGLRGALSGALFPEMKYGTAYCNAVEIGAVMPGHPKFDLNVEWAAKAKPIDDPHRPNYIRYTTIMDDGTSFRRYDLAERVPMFCRPGGRWAGREIANTGSWNASQHAEWNAIVLLGMQVAEIADHRQAIGGVLVLDSNNAADRVSKTEFAGEGITDLCASLWDGLGICAYANPDTARDLPKDVPRIYAPRKDGEGDQLFLIAEVGGKRLRVPYTGRDMQVAGHPALAQFLDQIRSTTPGGWPIATTGGFVATAWESSFGVFVCVENPMGPGPGGKPDILVHRTGSVTVRVRGLAGNAAIIDLCGLAPDPQRLPDAAISRVADRITVHLDWPRNDARIFWIASGR